MAHIPEIGGQLLSLHHHAPGLSPSRYLLLSFWLAQEAPGVEICLNEKRNLEFGTGSGFECIIRIYRYAMPR